MLRGRTLVWRADPGARTYVIALTHPDRTTTSHTTGVPRLRLPAGTPRRGTLRVVVLGRDATGRTGKPTRATFTLRAR
jgi:hypothetical protein